MKRKWILTGTAVALAAALTGCGSNVATNTQQQSSQEQAQELTQLISMEEAQEAAFKAANIEADNANILATTLSELAGAFIYKVEFTAGEYTYAYSINAETGAVMEMSSQELDQATPASEVAPSGDAAPSVGTVPSGSGEAVPSATAAPAQTTTNTGRVDEAKAQEIALNHAGVNAVDATITKSRLDYEGRRQVYEIEWYANGAKYDYEIAVDTGEIINAGYEEKTVVTDSNSINGTVSEADAKKTALERVSGATERDIYEWKFDYDDGRPEYEGKIIYGGVEYEFTVDATNGSFVEWEAEMVR